jgi:ABC-2 type transport system permease protein
VSKPTDSDPRAPSTDSDPRGSPTDKGTRGTPANAGTRGVGLHTLRHGLTLGRVDVRRILRTSVDRKSQLLAYAALVLLFGGAGGYGAYLFGRDVGVGAALPIDYTTLEVARGGFALVWLFFAGIVVVRTVGTRGTLENDVGVLSIVPTREAVLGALVSEFALGLAYALPLLGVIAAGYSVGAGTYTFLVTAPVVAAALSATAVAVAYPVGLAIRHVVTRIEFVARHKGSFIVLAFAAYMALILSDVLGNVVVTLFEPLQAAPTAWFADLLLLGSPAGASAPRAALAVLLVPVLAAASVVAATRVADRHWFADPVLAGSEEDDADVDPNTDRHDDGLLRRVEDALAGYVGRGTAAVTALAWKRAARAPLKLLYVAYPLLFAIGFIVEIVQTGEVPPPAPAAALLFVAWAGAVVFTLNPLGDQGSALPATVLSAVSGREFVGAHVLAGAIVTVPLGTVLVAALAVAVPLDPDALAAVVVGTPLSVLVGSLFAVGVGMAFPRYEAVNVTRSTKAVVPSLLAFLAYSLFLLLVVAAAGITYEPALEPLVAGVASWLLPFGLSVSGTTVGLAARVALVPLAVAPFASAWYAVRRFNAVTVD